MFLCCRRPEQRLPRWSPSTRHWDKKSSRYTPTLGVSVCTHHCVCVCVCVRVNKLNIYFQEEMSDYRLQHVMYEASCADKGTKIKYLTTIYTFYCVSHRVYSHSVVSQRGRYIYIATMDKILHSISSGAARAPPQWLEPLLREPRTPPLLSLLPLPRSGRHSLPGCHHHHLCLSQGALLYKSIAYPRI